MPQTKASRRPAQETFQSRLGGRSQFRPVVTSASHSEVLLLVDPDSRRRAQICSSIGSALSHIEPFESVEELSETWHRANPVLVHDSDDALASLLNHSMEMGCWMPMIAYHHESKAEQVVRALKQGVMDYLDWPFTPSQIKRVLSCSGEIDRRSRGWIRELRARRRLAKLTDRELEILRLLVEGSPSREIADVFQISPRTVETHRANMLRKLDVESTVKAIRLAIEGGLAADELQYSQRDI